MIKNSSSERFRRLRCTKGMSIHADLPEGHDLLCVAAVFVLVGAFAVLSVHIRPERGLARVARSDRGLEGLVRLQRKPSNARGGDLPQLRPTAKRPVDGGFAALALMGLQRLRQRCKRAIVVATHAGRFGQQQRGRGRRVVVARRQLARLLQERIAIAGSASAASLFGGCGKLATTTFFATGWMAVAVVRDFRAMSSSLVGFTLPTRAAHPPPLWHRPGSCRRRIP